MPSAILRTVVTAWTPGIRPTWTVKQVRQALRLHAEGDFSLSAQLIDSMGEDDELPGLIERWVDAILGSDFELRAVDAPNRQLSKRLVDQFEPRWWDTFPESDLDDFLRWYRWLGVSVAVLDWDRGGSNWNAKLRVLHPQFLWRDQTRDKWLYNAQEGQLEVTPGDGKWLLLTDGSRGWMRGVVRSLAIDWIAKQLTIRDWNRRNERYGLPIIKAMAPAIAEEGDKDEFWEDLKGLNNETIAMLPTHLGGVDAAKEVSYDLDLLELKQGNADTFEKLLDRIDRRFAIRILGANLGVEVDGQGSRAAAETHRGVEQSKAEAAATKLATELRWQGLYPVVSYNVAGATLEVTPWPHWDTDPPEDTKAEAEDQEKFGQAVKALQDAGFDVANLDELAEKHGLELKKREVVPPVAPTPPDPNQPPGDAEPEPDAKARAAVALTTSALPAATRAAAPEADGQGWIDGQGFADALVDSNTIEAERLLRPTLEAVAREVEAAEDYEDLRRRLRTLYADLDPSELIDLTNQAMLLAELAGRVAVNQDAGA